jgi:hypothetical protein
LGVGISGEIAVVFNVRHSFNLALVSVIAVGFVVNVAVAAPAPVGPVDEETSQSQSRSVPVNGSGPEETSVCPLPTDATINAAMSLLGQLEVPEFEECVAEASSCPATSPLTEEGKKILIAMEDAFSHARVGGGSDSSFVSFQDPQVGQTKDEFNYFDIPYGPDGRPDMNVIWELLHKAYGLPYIKGKVHPSLAYYINCDNYAWGGWLNNNCKHMSAIVVAGLQSRGVYCGQAAMRAHVCGEFYSKPPPGSRCSGWWIIDWYGNIRPAGPNEQLVLYNGQLVAPPVWGISPRAPKLVICPGYGLKDAPKDPTGAQKPGGAVQPKVPPAPSERQRR